MKKGKILERRSSRLRCLRNWALAALVLFCWQGSIYLLAGAIVPYVTAVLLCELSLVGGALIFSSGLGILGIKQIKTLNYLPALAVSAAAVVVLQALGL